MHDPDPELFFRLYNDEYLDNLRYEPCKVATFEVFESEVRPSFHFIVDLVVDGKSGRCRSDS